ncbi:MAG TPA: arsenate reductase ArsC [bacterium]|nr:arsenate reductase ArsC [bacterium]
MKKNVIFICIHNSARSQMAEAYLKHFASDRFNVWSAGLEPGKLNPVVVKAMALDGIDISGHTTKSVDEFIDGHIKFDFVVTVCDETAAEACPFFPGQGERHHWGFQDPSGLTGTDEEKLARTIQIRDQIKEKVKGFAGSKLS